ncbi:hypothetical protein HYC85_026106 [Camellia sinensis]|uniref:Pentacotripeptide-repeat region of PRORP domain-containing protein n=1 Tax=Camellia sinensis TaxID=4442 RepID=A0A7J7G381_CAMSI|nr:hypothetical protein HYC85_026106 [Camellia sinensis]
MKCLSLISLVRYLGHRRSSSRFLISLFSTETLTSSSPSSSSSSSSSVDSLYNRLVPFRDPKISIVPVLNAWAEEGRPVTKQELQSLLHLMKNFNRFKHALEISRWMSDRQYYKLSPTDVAVRLELISRVCGLERAEIFFNSISTNLKSFHAYGALLRVYVREKYVVKAEAIMQKMREMGMATTSFPYNMMISLYSKIGEHSKIHMLIQEMENLGIPLDMFTLKTQVSAYAMASDISRMEKILNHIEEDPDPYCIADWEVYSVAANGYLKVGLIEKALTVLKKMEGTMPVGRKLAFQHLVSLYSSTGLKDEVYRVWNIHRPLNEVHNPSYSEWETICTFYDFRVLNRLLVAYCRKGLFDKAELAISKAIEGRRPFASSWIILAVGYMQNKQMDKAVEMLKKALLVGRTTGWRPNSSTLDAFLEYLEGQGDVEVMEEIIMLLEDTGALTKDSYNRLLRTSVATGRSISSGVLDQMKMKGFTTDEVTQ